MASRNFKRKQALESEAKELHMQINIGAAGAPTLIHQLGVESVVRDGAGLYTITLDDTYVRLMGADIMHRAAAAEDLAFQLADADVSGAKTIQIRAHAAGVETDPSDGSILYIKLDLKNSSAR